MNLRGHTDWEVPQEVIDLVDRRFCDPDRHGYGRYWRNDRGEQIIKDILYSFILTSTRHLVRLQMFRGFEGLGGELWAREARALQRMSSMRPQGVPEILGGGSVDESDDFVYILTRSAGLTLASDFVLERIREKPLEALNHFGGLADALALMHEHSLAHRNLWHGVIEYDDTCMPPEVRLSRFEMSALVTNLVLLGKVQGDVLEKEVVQSALLAQSSEALACFAPERLEALAGRNADDDWIETERSDVYSLGVIAWQMFVGPLPKEADTIIRPDGSLDLEAAGSLRRALRQAIGVADLPIDIKGVLYTMLEEDWRDRPSAIDVCTDLAKHQTLNVRHWLSQTSGGAHQILFNASDMAKGIGHWQWLDSEPGSELWTGDLCELIQDDVRQGKIVYSQEGYWGKGGDRASEWKYIFLGEKAVWFCSLFRDNSGTGREHPEFLLVRRVVKREWPDSARAARLEPSAPCPEIEVSPVVHGISSMRIGEMVKGKPSWLTLFEPLKGRVESHGNREIFRQALDFLLDYQDALLLARYYAYKREGEPGQMIQLRYDTHRDQQMRDLYGRERRLHAYIGIYNGPHRPAFGPFFTSEATYDGPREVEIWRDNDGTPERYVATGIVRWSNHQDSVTIELNDDRYIPPEGWLRPANDFANAVNLKRQRTAKEDFLRFGKMLDYLRTPLGIAGPVSNWKDVGSDLRYPKEDSSTHEQRNDNQRFLIDMLRTTPLYMLMGPPGTGKTRTVATAVAAFLRREKEARVLLSAQSHFALDNLGETLVLDDETVVIRVTTGDSEAKVSPKMRKYLPQEQARQAILDIKAKVPVALKKFSDIDSEARRAAEEWLERVESSQAELAERLLRSASVILATTSAATPETLGYGARVGIFDWVIVEEVAKAWITEIAIPLVRGYRWTLVGDPEQLPAHRREDVDRLLEEFALEKYAGDVLGNYAANREAFAQVFDFFKHAFRQPPKKRPQTALQSAAGQLVRQFRMRKPIGELVSEAFYKGEYGRGLETPPEAERPARLSRPAVLAEDTPLVWMDTSDLKDCQEQPFWRNPGESQLICDMLSELDPWPTPNAPNNGPESLAVLTPYNQQRNSLNDLLASDVLEPRSKSDPRVPAPGPDVKLAHNVHTVQGREYDIVLVSLVRTGHLASPNSTGLGFLEWRYLINVLFSRARRQLIVFGNFDFYRGVGVEHWTKICKYFEAEGKIVRLKRADSSEED